MRQEGQAVGGRVQADPAAAARQPFGRWLESLSAEGASRDSGAALSDFEAANRKNLALLVQLRWIAVVGQIVTIAAAYLWLRVDLPLLPMALVRGGSGGAQYRLLGRGARPAAR